MNLLKKLSEKIKTNNMDVEKKSKIKRRLSKTAIASLVLASVVAFTACTYTPSPNTPIDPDQPGITTPVDPDNPSTNHSELLYDIISNSYYSTVKDCFMQDNPRSDSQLYDPIPYGFLEDNGYNIETIKNNTLECDSVAYIKEGENRNLYIATRIENEGDTPYYTCYTLKYSLSDDELNDLIMLHRNGYFEAPLFIQELSYQKTPIVVSEANITVSALNGIVDMFKGSESLSTGLFSTNNITVDLLDFSVKNQKVNISVRPASIRNFTGDVEIRFAEIIPGGPTVPITAINNGMVLSGPESRYAFESDDKRNEYKNNYDTVTYYDTQIKYSFNFELESNLTNNNNL